jgi:hypothetical protein
MYEKIHYIGDALYLSHVENILDSERAIFLFLFLCVLSYAII